MHAGPCSAAYSLARPHLQIWIVLIRQGHPRRILHLLIILLQQRLIDLDGWRSQGNTRDELQPGVPHQLPRQPQKRLLEVVVGLGRDVVVLQVLLAVEGDGLGFHFALFHVHFVAAEHDGHVFADADEIAVPVWDVLVGDPAGYVEHDNAALSVDVVAVAEAAEFFLPGRVPNIELDAAVVLRRGVSMGFVVG